MKKKEQLFNDLKINDETVLAVVKTENVFHSNALEFEVVFSNNKDEIGKTIYTNNQNYPQVYINNSLLTVIQKYNILIWKENNQ